MTTHHRKGRAYLAMQLLLLLSYPVPSVALLEMIQYIVVEIINFFRNRTIGPQCKTLPSIPDFDFNRYVAKSWFVQKHQVTEYFDYSERYCMVVTYSTVNQTINGRAQMRFYHTGQGGGGINVNPYISDMNCVTEYGDFGGQFKLGPCFLPSFLVFLGGPWYVVATDYDNYAIVTAGPLTIRGECDDASGLCTLPNRGEINDPGSWFGQRQGVFFFTRARVADATLLAQMDRMAIDMGICTVAMLPVTNQGCTFEGAGIKE